MPPEEAGQEPDPAAHLPHQIRREGRRKPPNVCGRLLRTQEGTCSCIPLLRAFATPRAWHRQAKRCPPPVPPRWAPSSAPAFAVSSLPSGVAWRVPFAAFQIRSCALARILRVRLSGRQAAGRKRDPRGDRLSASRLPLEQAVFLEKGRDQDQRREARRLLEDSRGIAELGRRMLPASQAKLPVGNSQLVEDPPE